MTEQVHATVPTSDGLTDLRRSVAGAVIAPADAGYDELRRSFNALVDRRPRVIVRCLGAGDVATAFDFARAHAMDVAVRGGGHNPAGHCVCDDGLVIDLSLMRRVEVDPAAGRAHSEAERPGSTSTRRRRRSASSHQEASSARPAWRVSPSAAGSAT